MRNFIESLTYVCKDSINSKALLIETSIIETTSTRLMDVDLPFWKPCCVIEINFVVKLQNLSTNIFSNILGMIESFVIER
jgi:hypothetical protein